MRTIKFRGFDKGPGNKGWVYGYLTSDMKVTLTGTEPRMMIAGYEVDEDSIGQFTGLHDKKGAEIYEGDIVKFLSFERSRSNYVTGIVTFYKCCYELKLIDSRIDAYLLSGLDDSQSYRLEVIGNVHDNPELLKHANPQKPK